MATTIYFNYLLTKLLQPQHSRYMSGKTIKNKIQKNKKYKILQQ